MFSRDMRHHRSAPRSLNEAFGPYSKWHVERKNEAKAWLWAIGCGAVVGVFWWLVVAVVS